MWGIFLHFQAGNRKVGSCAFSGAALVGQAVFCPIIEPYAFHDIPDSISCGSWLIGRGETECRKLFLRHAYAIIDNCKIKGVFRYGACNGSRIPWRIAFSTIGWRIRFKMLHPRILSGICSFRPMGCSKRKFCSFTYTSTCNRASRREIMSRPLFRLSL